MDVGICAIVTDFRGRLLLQQPTGSSLHPPHGPLEPGRLPGDALAQLVRAQTGLIIWPVRLTGLYYRAGALTFCWRCIMRGGDLPPPEGQPPAGFFDSVPLPAALPSPWRQRVDEALHHKGGPPVLRAEGDTVARLGRLFGRAPAAAPWEVDVVVWPEAELGLGLWQRGADGTLRLPRATNPNEAPWETAARLLRTLAPGVAWGAPRLALAQIADDRPAMTLAFAAATTGGAFRPATSLVVTAAAVDPVAPLDADDRKIAAALDPSGESPPFLLLPGKGASRNG